MIYISVKGMDDGKFQTDMKYPSEKAEGLTEEFFGDIRISGNLVKIKDRYNFDGVVECMAKFTCDRTLEEYSELIRNDLKWTCLRSSEDIIDEEDRIREPGVLSIQNDKDEIDITEEVAEQLIVAIPMKRIAPEYREKDIDEIYPEHVADESAMKTDAAWSKLKNLKFN